MRNTNYPNVIINRQRMQSLHNNNNNNNSSSNSNNIISSNSNNNHSIINTTKYQEMQSNHPIYEGLDPNIGNYNTSSSTANYDGIQQYSNVTDIDPNFFTANDYDNAAGKFYECLRMN